MLPPAVTNGEEQPVLSARLRQAGALVAAALLAAVLAPAAAVAAPVAPTIHFPHLALLPGGFAFESIYLTRDDTFVLHDVTVTLDATRAAGVATVRPYSDPGPCTATGAVSTCTFDTLAQEAYIAYIAMFEVRAVDGAVVGDEGTVTP
jgi:hypothetical protein